MARPDEKLGVEHEAADRPSTSLRNSGRRHPSLYKDPERTKPSPSPELDRRELEGLRDLDRPTLIAKFRAVYHQEPPRCLSRPMLALAIGYRLQEQAFGGLKPSVRKNLLLARPADSGAIATPGTVLIREWGGRQHAVTVERDHFEYEGQRFTSLTEVARHITGQKRSGPAFFRLRRHG